MSSNLGKYFIIFFLVNLIYLNGKVFTLISLDDFDTIDELKFVNNEGIWRLTLSKYCLNASYAIPKHNFLSFFAFNAETNETSKRPIFEIPFKDQIKNYLVLLEKDESKTSSIKYSFVDNDLDFPNLSALIFNRSDKPVLMKIGTEIFKIPAKAKRNLQLNLGNKDTFNERIVFASQQADQSIDYFYSSFWRMYDYQKKICFIDYDQEKDRLYLRDILIN